ncbi:hypothetical protein [Moorena sp. SIO3I6]|uniref:hypothetical protein n=1 Tax=Moorena sp. SIO3I6 TaxID=2607831 RepID=UPI0013F9DFE0|nr:hypothetical protein [Moorena sp. SIO3I6]NEO48156.1 hypothetical protein [Moorena sp. SIO4A3]NEP27194.1 hypothetical protein [Moorena sp. SIO3I6]
MIKEYIQNYFFIFVKIRYAMKPSAKSDRFPTFPLFPTPYSLLPVPFKKTRLTKGHAKSDRIP